MTRPVAARTLTARSGVLTAACLLALAVSGCNGSDTTGGESPSPAPTSAGATSPSTTSTPPATQAPSSPASSPTEQPGDTAAPSPSAASTPPKVEALLRAGKLGLSRVPGSTVYSIESENDGNTWEVELVTSDGTKHEMHISADGRTVARAPKRDGRNAKYSDRVKAAKLDYRAAVDVLLDTVPNAQIKELNLDHERGTVVWEADVVTTSGTARSLEIDAASGKVIQNKLDT